MKIHKKAFAVLLLSLPLALTGLAGCANSTQKGVTEVIVGTGSSYNPYCFLNEKNELTGFEKAVLDEIDARLPDYSLTYQIFDFANILLSLESGKIDLAAHQFEFNTERNEKYLYGTEGYTTYELYLVVREEEDSIQSFEDLKGKKLISTSTTNNAYYIANKWNEENGKPFEIIFSNSTPLMIEDLENGVGDAFISVERNVPRYQEEYDAKIKTTGEPVSDSQTFYLFNKQTGSELQKVFDKTLADLKADGTLSKLSVEWLGADYTPQD